MDSETRLTAWQETGGPGVVTVARSTQLSTGSPGTDALTTRAEFAAEVGPCLALVAPTGMDQAERKTWLGAAHKALAHIDAATLSRAAQVAMLRADHPSKLVPLIAAEAERLASGYRPISTIHAVPCEPCPPETEDARRDRLELAGLMRGLRERMEANAA